MNRILIVCPYPANTAASQRFRFEQYLELLRKNGFHYQLFPFWSRSAWDILYKKGHHLHKSLFLVSGFVLRFALLFKLKNFDLVFLHREATPIGPPWFEWLAVKVYGKKLVFDFDDAIWTSESNQEPLYWKILKWRSKFYSICKWSFSVSAGNGYLASKASSYCSNVSVIPTTLDTTKYNDIKQHDKSASLVIGWTGTQSTLPYLKPILPVFEAIVNKYNVRIIVVSNRTPDFDLPNLTFVKWTEENEISDLLEIDIGIMPLPDDDWARGKCGFKALQYMALGIPAIASPVGTNKEIIRHMENGLLASTNAEWLETLEMLIQDPGLRSALGESGRKTVEDGFSVRSNSDRFLRMFQIS